MYLDENETKFVRDDAEDTVDLLGRGPIAIVMARALHKIWYDRNKALDPIEDWDIAGFVGHIDAPWGGGKSTFANYISATLNPKPIEQESFLWEAYGKQPEPRPVFLAHSPTPGENNYSHTEQEERVPWLVVNFNAWRNQHISPPWWTFWDSFRLQTRAQIKNEDVTGFSTDGDIQRSSQFLRSSKLTFHEYFWRLRSSPRVWIAVVVTLLLGFAAIFPEVILGAPTDSLDKAQKAATATTISSITTLGSLLSGAAAIWTLLAEKFLPASGQRTVLGASDPFFRFRKHFADYCTALERPILVVIDDLDRCQADYIAELLRGLQTIFRSPQVTFLLLGDVRWIRRAFEVAHKEMVVDMDGGGQSMGMRFVEKTVQMSVVLPPVPEELRERYSMAQVRDREDDAQEVVEDIVQASIASITQGASTLEAINQVNQRIEEQIADHENADTLRFQIRNQANRDLLLSPRISGDIEKEIEHMLDPIAHLLPANPRQIKRTINALTLYQSIALYLGYLEGDNKTLKNKWQQLARWVCLKTEWPQAAVALSENPGLANQIQNNEEKELDWLNIEVKNLVCADADRDLIGLDATAIDWLRQVVLVADA